MRINKIIVPVLVAIATSTFIGCNGSNSNDIKIEEDEQNITTKSYIINKSENRDIPIDANMLAQTQDTKIKITRDIEKDTMNVYVIEGSVEVK